MRYFVQLDDTEIELEVRGAATGAEAFVVEGGRVRDEPVRFDSSSTPDGFVVRTPGGVLDAAVVSGDRGLLVGIAGRTLTVRVQSAHERELARGARPSGGSGVVSSPMPGKVLQLFVQIGDRVEAGARLAVIEAMKMENEICADSAGTVRSIFVGPGDTIDGGAPVFELGADDDGS
jgi:biotin carboxyl carrier protein